MKPLIVQFSLFSYYFLLLRPKHLQHPVLKHPHNLQMDPCHHGMTSPRAVDEGDGLVVWRVAANVFNKQSRTGDKGLCLPAGDWVRG